MKKNSAISTLIFVLIFGIGGGIAYLLYDSARAESVLLAIGSFIVAVLAASAVQVADQWERVIVLRLGKYRALRGPGYFLLFR